MNLNIDTDVGVEFEIIGQRQNFAISVLRSTGRIKSEMNKSGRSLKIMAMIDPHDDDFGTICNCAVRYAVGHRTYIPSLVMDFIKPHLSELSDKTLWYFQNDLKERARITRDFADDWAGDEWKQFQKLVYEELIRRTNQRTK
jgi:pyruvate formate-lyase activating enzyme-like uncharacterized protein